MNQFKKEFKEVLKLIEKYDRICIFRHEMPDFDAFGTQMGLYSFIKDNYPNKDLHFVGEGHKNFIPSLFPEPEVLDDSWFDKSFLAIVVDTANTKRISDKRCLKSQMIIKFDHHPAVENYGNINIVDEKIAAASQLLTEFAVFSKKKISKTTARYFFIGIVGDTGRFQYPDTSPQTLYLAAKLMETGLDTNNIYLTMYEKDIDDLENLKFVLNSHVVTDKGTCYYIFKDEDLKRFNMATDEGKLHINTFRSIKGINIVVSVTENIAKNEYKVSIRSSRTKINEVAAKYEGGGHEFAAGATLHSLADLPNLIADLDNLQ